MVGIFRVAFRICGRHWQPLLGVAFILVGPATLLTLLLSANYDAVYRDVYPFGGEELFPATDAEQERLGGALVAYGLASLLESLLVLISTLGVASIVAADYHARMPSLGLALRVCLSKSLHVIAVGLILWLVLVGIFIGVVFLALIHPVVGALTGLAAALYVLVQFSVTTPVLAIEDTGVRRAMGRSRHLVKENWWRTAVVLVISVVLTFLLSLLLGLGLGLAFGIPAAMLDLDVDLVASVVGSLTFLLLLPVGSVILGVLYIDLRARRDPRTSRS